MAYTTARIQFISNDRQGTEREYSDRSLIQLIEIKFPNAVLRALDVDNHNQKIFEIPLQRKDQYKFGNSKDNPDEVLSNDGIYRLWLNELSHNAFHVELQKYFQQLELMNLSDENSPRPNRNNIRANNSKTTDTSYEDYRVKPVEPVRTTPSIVSPKDLLSDVNLLSQYIEQGDIQEAAQKASQLASQGVLLQAKPSTSTLNEKEFTIQVQLDGNEYGVDQNGARIPVNVFRSTTVRELRAVFELAYQYPPTNQYFFVNGCLACDDSTMKDLNVGPNSLFILFLLIHSRKTGPWKCSACGTNNKTHNLRCILCSAKR